MSIYFALLLLAGIVHFNSIEGIKLKLGIELNIRDSAGKIKMKNYQ